MIQNMKGLQGLHLSQVDDVGELSNFPHLRRLIISDTEIENADCFLELKALQCLQLIYCDMHSQELKRLQKAMAGMDFQWRKSR